MKGLAIRLARALNRVWQRTGRVFADRYHATVVDAPRHARNVLRYVLQNGRKHGSHNSPGPDPLSSGPAYRGWRDRSPELAAPDRRVVAAKHWLFNDGWTRYCAPFSTAEIPPHGTSPRIWATQRKDERRRRRAA